MLKGLRGNKYGLSYVNKRTQNQFASKKIYCGLNEKTYNSISDLSRDLKIHRNTIQGQLKGKITNKLKLKYAEK
jgi:transcriptional antiterminator